MTPTQKDALRAEIEAGQITVVVGTGTSIYATDRQPAASWTGLLRLGVQFCETWSKPKPHSEWLTKQLDQLNNPTLPNLLEVAVEIEKRLGAPDGGLFREFLKGTIGALTVQRREMLDGIAALVEAGAQIATTNYDGLIESVINYPAVPWTNSNKAEVVMRGRDKGVLHLHGYWDEPKSVVLGIRSYDAVRTDPHAQAVQRYLAFARTLVFIGYGDGLDDPNFGHLLDWLRQNLPPAGFYHFRLCRNAEEEALRAKHQLDERILVVSYGEHYEDLGTFLHTLVHPVDSVLKTTRSPSIGQSRTADATTATFSDGVKFETDCIVDVASITSLLQRTPSPAAPPLLWHPSVRTEIVRLEDWWDHFEDRSNVITWAENDPLHRANILSGLRAELRKARERVQERLRHFPQALGHALVQTTGVDADLRVQSIGNLTGFMALQLIRLLRIAHRNLPDPGPREHLSFATLPDVPSWLVELVPSRSVLGSYVFDEDSFLKARVGSKEDSYETIVMPRMQAEYLHKSMRTDDLPTFLRWVLPQWLLYGFETVITPEYWRVWVLTDGLNRECYMSGQERPWA